MSVSFLRVLTGRLALLLNPPEQQTAATCLSLALSLACPWLPDPIRLLKKEALPGAHCSWRHGNDSLCAWDGLVMFSAFHTEAQNQKRI